MNVEAMSNKPQLLSGPFTTAMASQQGIGRHVLRRMLREGSVKRVTAGVYAEAGVEWSVEMRARAIALVASPHQVVCDRTAAWIWGIDAYAWPDLPEPPIETAARRGHSACDRKAVSGHTRDLADHDITVVGGVAVTTPLRTAVDLACVLERRDALAALDAFRREHALTIGGLKAALARYAGRRGVIQARELISLADPRAESARESWTRLAIIDAGLPAPEPQVWIEVDGVRIYRLDLAYRRHRVVVEYDGWEAHERTDEQKEHDASRREWLRRNGWTVIVVRKGDFTGGALERWISELREALRSAYSNRRTLERGSKRRDW